MHGALREMLTFLRGGANTANRMSRQFQIAGDGFSRHRKLSQRQKSAGAAELKLLGEPFAFFVSL